MQCDDARWPILERVDSGFTSSQDKRKRIVTFLKVDKGVAPEKDGVQLMKPVPDLAALLDRATANRIFGTKMRSVIKQASRSHGVVACFSRALVEGLSVGQSEDEYNRVLEASIQSIFEASNT